MSEKGSFNTKKRIKSIKWSAIMNVFCTFAL
ncbi:unknown [Prevotella sp. CAG:1124]|nr:unknown [Prevotella sp. CAG:1124]